MLTTVTSSDKELQRSDGLHSPWLLTCLWGKRSVKATGFSYWSHVMESCCKTSCAGTIFWTKWSALQMPLNKLDISCCNRYAEPVKYWFEGGGLRTLKLSVSQAVIAVDGWWWENRLYISVCKVMVFLTTVRRLWIGFAFLDCTLD